MENPFKIILEKLNSIEELLKHQKAIEPTITSTQPLTEILTLNEAAEFLYQSKSSLYKKAAEWTIQHYKVGKKLYFKRMDLIDGLRYIESKHGMILSEKPKLMFLYQDGIDVGLFSARFCNIKI